MKPGDLMRCPVLHVTMQAHVCVERQLARCPGAHSPAAFLPCGTGRCDYGRRVRREMPTGWEPKPYRMLRGDLKQQRSARVAYYRRTVSDPYGITEATYRKVEVPPLPAVVVEQLVQLTRKPEVRMTEPKPVVKSKPLPKRARLPDPATLPASYLFRCAQVFLRRMRSQIPRSA